MHGYLRDVRQKPDKYAWLKKSRTITVESNKVPANSDLHKLLETARSDL